MVDLEQLICRRQDQLRGRSLTYWERFYEGVRDRLRSVDWSFVGLCICIVAWAACQVVIELGKIAQACHVAP